MQRVEFIKTNQRLLREITSKGFSSLNVYVFFLILKKHNDSGLIPNFSTAFTKLLMKEYSFSRNTIKNRCQQLQSLGYAQYNPNADTLHVVSVNFLKSKYGILTSNKKFDKIKLENRNHKAITAQLRAVASDLYLKNKVKSYKIQQRDKNGLGSSAKGLRLSLPEFITNISRVELAAVIGSKHSSTGHRMMSRLKDFNLVHEDTPQAIYIKDCTKVEFQHCYLRPRVNNHYYYRYGKLYQQISNRVRFSNYHLHITDLIN